MRPWIGFSAATTRSARLAAGVAIALALAGCTTAPAYLPTAPRFEGTPVWQVAADRIEIEVAPEVTPPEPAVAARLAEPPLATAKRWPAARLRTSPGARGTVVYRIERAEATERYLPRKSGVTATFANNAEAELTVAFTVAISETDALGTRRGTARAEASVTGTLREKADEDDHRKLWERLMRDAAERLDKELQAQVPNALRSAGQIE